MRSVAAQDNGPWPRAPTKCRPRRSSPASSVSPWSRRVAWKRLRITDAYCLVEGRTTIIQIMPEGTPVKKGQIVCQLDSAALNDQLVNQRITKRRPRPTTRTPSSTREVAEIAVREYEEGTLQAGTGRLNGCDHRGPIGDSESRSPARADPGRPQADERRARRERSGRLRPPISWPSSTSRTASKPPS